MNEITFNCIKCGSISKIKTKSVLENRKEWNCPFPEFKFCGKCVDNIKFKYFKCEECDKEFTLTSAQFKRRKYSKLKMNQCFECAKKDQLLQMAQTKMEKYGDPYWSNPDKMVETYRNKSDDELRRIHDKRLNSIYNKYGSFSNSEKTKETWQNKSTDDINKMIQKRNKTMMERYNVDNISKTLYRKYEISKQVSDPNSAFQIGYQEYAKNIPDSVKNKISSAMKESWKNPEYRNNQVDKHKKWAQANKSHYSTIMTSHWNSLSTEDRTNKVRHALTSRGINKLHKKFESYFMNSYISNQFRYEAETTIALHDNTKSWDYGIYDKITNDLVMVIDLDGTFFHADNCDYNGIQNREEYDEKRYMMVPDNTKLSIIYEDLFTESFDKMVKDLMIDYDNFIQSQFKLCRMMPFPYPSYNNDELMKSYIKLQRLTANKYLRLSTNTRVGDRIINHFHHSIYSANRNGKIRPYDAWYDDELLMKVIKNRIIYVNTLNPNKILQGFNISKIAQRVSVFSAGRAKLLIDEYLNEYNTIFDPFSGFSGRMLGTTSLGKRYIGQDISPLHVKESNEIIEFLSLENKATVIQRNILQSSGKYDCLFTCPPYSDKEQWYDVPIDTRNCDDWIDICLNQFKCKKYLFVVDATERYKDNIVDIIKNKSHMNSNNEYVILI